MTIGDVVLYQSYYTTIITQLTNIMNLVPIMAKGFESLHSIGEVMASYDEEDYTGEKSGGSYKRNSGIPACDLPVSRGQ